MGWMVATIALGCLFLFSLLTITIHGIEEKWDALNFCSMYLCVFLMPIVWPWLIWNAVYERKQKIKCENCKHHKACEGPSSFEDCAIK